METETTKGSKNQTKKITKTHRVILRDNIQGITRPALKRLCLRAGCARMQGTVYEEIRGVLKVYLEEMMHKIVGLTEFSRRKTIKKDDLDAAFQICGKFLVVDINKNKKGSTYSASGSRPRASKTNDESENGEKKARRFRPGIVTLRDIKFQQKKSDSLAIPKLNFYRLVKEISQDFYDGDLKFQKPFIEVFQVATEEYLIDLLQSSYACAIHASRTTITPKDIQLARFIRKE